MRSLNRCLNSCARYAPRHGTLQCTPGINPRTRESVQPLVTILLIMAIRQAWAKHTTSRLLQTTVPVTAVYHLWVLPQQSAQMLGRTLLGLHIPNLVCPRNNYILHLWFDLSVAGRFGMDSIVEDHSSRALVSQIHFHHQT